VIPRSESELKAGYPDLLDGADDPALLHVAQVLDAGYNLHRAPAGIRSLAPVRPAGHVWDALDRLGYPERAEPVGPKRWHIHTKLYAAFTLVAACAVLLATGVSIAGQNSITNLGPPLPVQSTNANFPLSGFHRINTSLNRHGRPVLLVIGTLAGPIGHGTFNVFDHKSAVERWPVIKALDQFGTFTGVRAAPALCQKDATTGHIVCQVATYDWSRAAYRSRYLVFEHKDLLDRQDRSFQTLSPTERVLYNRYSRNPGRWTLFPGRPDYVVGTVANSNSPGGATSIRQLPLLLVGNYLQTVSQVAISGDFEDTLTGSARDASGNLPNVQNGLSFATVQKALLHGKNPRDTQLILDVNSEANIITALICHATKGQPKSVCTRPTIKQILKYVR